MVINTLRIIGVSKLEVNYEHLFSDFLKVNSKLVIEVFNKAKSFTNKIDEKYEYVKVELLAGDTGVSIAYIYIKTSEYNNSNYANTSV